MFADCYYLDSWEAISDSILLNGMVPLLSRKKLKENKVIVNNHKPRMPCKNTPHLQTETYNSVFKKHYMITKAILC